LEVSSGKTKAETENKPNEHKYNLEADNKSEKGDYDMDVEECPSL